MVRFLDLDCVKLRKHFQIARNYVGHVQENYLKLQSQRVSHNRRQSLPNQGQKSTVTQFNCGRKIQIVIVSSSDTVPIRLHTFIPLVVNLNNFFSRKVLRAYQDSWHNRCRFLFCCSSASDRNSNSFADIARLLSDFFRDLDVVPSDVIVGLVLLRKFQKIEQKAIVEQVSFLIL